ncbi:MAG: hypothetical protein N2378_05855 [Chloroflexaceae bacterium]|nr:hypothetical protein [Chloroflexaceae bacterium]
MPLISVTEEELAWLERRRAARRWAEQRGIAAMLTPTVPEIMYRLRRLIGDEPMSRDAGKWRNRAGQWPGRVLALIANLECRIADGQPIRSPAAYAEKMWTKYLADDAVAPRPAPPAPCAP